MDNFSLKLNNDGKEWSFPFSSSLTTFRGKERKKVSDLYLFSHRVSLEGLDGLWESIREREYSIKSMLIESVWNGEWGWDDERKREIADEIRNGSLDSAITNWSHLLPQSEIEEAERLMQMDLLEYSLSLDEKDTRKKTALFADAEAERLVSPHFSLPWSLKAGPWGDEEDENSWFAAVKDEKGTEGRLSLAPRLFTFSWMSLADETGNGNMKNLGEKTDVLSDFFRSQSEEAKTLRNALSSMKASVNGSAEWDPVHAKWRYYNRKGRKGDFLGLPIAEKKFTTILSFISSFPFLGNEVWFFEDAEKGLDRKGRDILSSLIADLSVSLDWKVIVSSEDDDFVSDIEKKAYLFLSRDEMKTYCVTEDGITLDGRELLPSEKGEAEVSVEKTLRTKPRTFFEMTTGIDMEPYFTASFNGVCAYLNRFLEIISDKPCMEDEGVVSALEETFRSASLILNGRYAPTEPVSWNGNFREFIALNMTDDAEADIRERRTNRYIEISGADSRHIGFSQEKGGEDRRPWLMERMDELTVSLWTLVRRTEEAGVRFNSNTMVYKSLDALLYYLSDAYYITERGKVHRHIMKDVKDRIEYLYTYYGMKKVLKKVQG